MILLSANNVNKVYGEKIIFKDLTLGIEHTDKIGLIGINGTGKTTLLRIIAGFETPDKGEIITANGLVVEYLPQNPVFDDEATVLQQIFKGEAPLMKLLRSYEETSYLLEKNPEEQALQERLLKLSVQMDAQDAWQLESEAKAILTKLGITQFEEKVGKLSGGQRKRIALAGALIRPCQLLILDEPTNHLDNATIDYLEELLATKKCAVLMVTHDRYFLDRVTNKIVELEDGKLYKYEGNYSTFLALKAEREASDRRMQEKERALFKQELEWMRKGVEARRTKQKARQDRFYDLEENMNNKVEEKMDIALATSRLGKKIIEVKAVDKSFGTKKIVSDFTYTVVREDRIGIIGKNGLGKSTLLNMIAGSVMPDQGEIILGDTVRVGYYTQESKDMNENLRVIDYIKEKAEFIKAQDGTMVSASKMLERFLFPSHVQYTPIGKLSGGERRRLYLLGILMNNINVLLLDEPTNDLDIQTLQVLEEYIRQFDGPVITVSHDRYFLDRMATKIFDFEGKGAITQYPGNYSDYHERQKQKENIVEKTDTKEKKTSYKEQQLPPKLKFTYKEKQEYETIDETIMLLEEKIENLEKDILKFATDFAKLQKLSEQKEILETELLQKMDRWQYLNELAEKITTQGMGSPSCL